MTHDPTGPVEVPVELQAEIEQAFDGVATVADRELVEVVDAIHAFLDAWGGRELHDQLLDNLLLMMQQTDPTSEEASDRLRDWIKDASTKLLLRAKDLGLDSSSIVVFHPLTRRLRLWTVGSTTHDAHAD